MLRHDRTIRSLINRESQQIPAGGNQRVRLFRGAGTSWMF